MDLPAQQSGVRVSSVEVWLEDICSIDPPLLFGLARCCSKGLKKLLGGSSFGAEIDVAIFVWEVHEFFIS